MQLELHIGYVYDSAEAPMNPSAYTPKYVRGARLPHLWIRPLALDLTRSTPTVDLKNVLELSEEDRRLRRYSTLDLCQFSAFTLIINSNHSQLQRADDFVRHLNAKSRGHSRLPLCVVDLGVDFKIVFPEKATEWLNSFRLGPEQCGDVLVSTDQHILAVLKDKTSAEQLVDILNSAIGF